MPNYPGSQNKIPENSLKSGAMMSNSSNLEQFIRQQRNAFDTAEPNPLIWACIENAMNRAENGDRLEQYLLINRPLFDTAATPDSIWENVEQALKQTPSDPLESFIRDNRTAFDTNTPDLRVWAAIEQAVPAQSAKIIGMPWHRALLRSAAAIALLITGISIGVWYGRADMSGQTGMAMSEVSTEYAELEQYYQRDISAKQDKLATLVSNRDQDLNADLLQMDKVMSELRQELANVPPGNREKVVRAMIENYKAKAAILERVLGHLEQQKQPATTNSGNYEVDNI